jgi:AcrR family transcriptional regulator
MGRPTRAEATELEHRLRQAALELFLERGFDGTTMEEVSRCAGISKRTLYAKYPDKQALFAKVLPWALSRMKWAEPRLPEDTGLLRDQLILIGRAVVARLRDPQVVRLTRMAMAEAHRFPEFAVSAQTLSWSPRIQTLMDLLDRHAQLGDIVIDDSETTAELFLSLVGGMTARLAAFGVRRTRAEEHRHVEQAVDMFLNGVLPR